MRPSLYSKIAINISIFHRIRGARALPDAERSACSPGPSCELTCSLCSSGIMCSCPMAGTSQQGDRWWFELTEDSATMSKTRAGAELIVVL